MAPGAAGASATIELLMLAGFCRSVSYLTNGLRLPVEEGSRASRHKASSNHFLRKVPMFRKPDFSR